MLERLAVIGGTGLASLKGLQVTGREVVNTPYGEPSAPLIHGVLAGRDLTFLARHGYGHHNIPPHRVNYRANVWALKHIGVTGIVAVAAVGSIHPQFEPGTVAFPDQLIDYTWSRGHTFFEDELQRVVHVDFTQPYCAALRTVLAAAAREARVAAMEGGTYGVTQGPRLETAAEIDRMERDGCDMVGMTGMPEAALAREVDIAYAHCAVSANWAAGRGQGPITREILEHNLNAGMRQVHALLEAISAGG